MHVLSVKLRLLVLALSLALVTSLLAACGGTEATPTNVIASSTKPAPTATATTVGSPDQSIGDPTPTPMASQPTIGPISTSPASQQADGPTHTPADVPTPTPTDGVSPPLATLNPPGLTATPTSTVVSVEVGYKVGQRAPDFLVTAVNGQEFSLASFQGSPVILYFFATW